MNRRYFISGSLAFGASSFASLALSHTPVDDYVLPEEFLPREVQLETEVPAGELHVDPNLFRLYWTLPDNKAIQYTVGVGRGNLYHSGTFTVGEKREWPSWQPTPAMIQRNPDAYSQFAVGKRYENGMPGGVRNPLGARALYLFTDEGRDTYLRIHGTNQPSTIGTAVSNGCARLINEHVVDLYERVPVGTKVVLGEKVGGAPAHSDL